MFDTKLELDLPRLARRLIYNTYADTYLVYYIYTYLCVHNGITLVPTERSNKLRNLIDFLLKIEITIDQFKWKAVNKSWEFLESGKTITANDNNVYKVS